MKPTEIQQIPSTIAALEDYVPFARDHLPESIWAYIHSGSADDHSFRQNQQRYGSIQLYNRVLRDLSHGNTRTQLLGRSCAHPLMLAPVSYQKMAHPDGEMAVAMAAAAQETPYVLSTLASTRLEEVATCGGEQWFQLYFQTSRARTLPLIRRAEESGYRAIMVTVDSPVNGLRNALQRVGFDMPPGISAVNLKDLPDTPLVDVPEGGSQIFQGLMSKAPTWQDIDWLKRQTPLPIIIKGILHPDDARLARDHGAEGIVISNHGGRTLDTAPSPIDVLPEIRAAVGQDYLLLIDSGIRRGSDVFKALALGANAAMIGRPIMYALATAGAMGVAHVIRLLRDELEVTMALTGCATIKDIGPHCLWRPN